MAEIHHSPLVADSPQGQAVTEYLDQLCAQLGTLPAERQAELRRELSAHLYQVLADVGQPATASEAVLLGRLVHEFGDPTTIGIQLARSVCPVRKTGTARFWANALVFAINSFTIWFCGWVLSGLLTADTSYGWQASLVCSGAIPFLYGFLWGLRRPVGQSDWRSAGGLAAICLLATALVAPPPWFSWLDWHSSLLAMWLLIALGACGMVRAAIAVQECRLALKQ
ncbi:MAG: hypothetical protein JO316_24655 [Abitibacteriaceae bacterium]|nr:hypothetical protein [Abditibacteriaceae bacterium]MBV9868558.1 hypothetical protein [Abditibacteriaceae bacterium]